MAESALIPGRADAAGTAAYAARFDDVAAGHFRRTLGGLRFSSIGLGGGGFSRRPAPESTDVYEGWIETVRLAVNRGLNVFDTAISYGEELSERIIGHALLRAFLNDGVSREEVVVVTKGGYLPFSAERYRERYPGAAAPVGGLHSIEPAFLKDQIEQSRRNLGLETIDGYLLHNLEDQFAALDRAEALDRARSAFETIEEAVAGGRVGWYGVASAEGFRLPGRGFHSLEELLDLAGEVGGRDHHFRAVEVPFNLATQEALTARRHRVGDVPASLLEASRARNITVLTSVSIGRGRLPFPVPEALRAASPGLESDVQQVLQFTRSVAGVTTALVGMSRREHVEEIAAMRWTAPLDLSAPAGATATAAGPRRRGSPPTP